MMERMIAEQVDYRTLQRQCRLECQPLVDEIVRVESTSSRPMYISAGKMEIEYGPHPPKVQTYLDLLQKLIGEIVDRYKKQAGLGVNRAKS